MQFHTGTPTTASVQRRELPRLARRTSGRLHLLAFGGGAFLFALGLIAWASIGGAHSIEDLLIVLDLAVGGTVLATSALVGRARSAESKRDAQLVALQAAARRMSASLTVEEVGRAVVEEARRVIDYHNARVYIREGTDDLVPVAFEGRVGEYEKVDMEILRTKVGEGFTGWVAAHGTPLRIDDANLDPRGVTIEGTDDIDESMLVVPMLHDDRLMGVITLSKLGLRQFEDDDLRLLRILGDQAATAFSGTAHLAETNRLAAELRQLLDMSSALSRSLDPRAVANLMADHLARVTGADEAMISDWDPASDRLRTLGCFPAARLEHAEPFYELAGYPQTRQVLEEGGMVVVDVEDPQADPAEAALLRDSAMGGLVMVALVAKGVAIGLIELTFRGRPTTDVSRLSLARTMANEAAMALENARLYETARNLADRDPLTGFFNHRYLHERLSEEVVRAVRNRRPLSVLMLDLDDFKVVNDTFGHLYGDRVLVHVAEQVRSTLRASDVPARYGGDEFAVILPETDREAAAAVAERILEAFERSPFTDEARRTFSVSASIGVATHIQDGRSATELIATADAGLYASKDAGGNRATSVGRSVAAHVRLAADATASGDDDREHEPLAAGRRLTAD